MAEDLYSIRDQEKFKEEWIEKLQIQGLLPINIIQSEIDKIRWNDNLKCWEILLNKNSGEMVIVHELGHLYFPKLIEDDRLLPKLQKPDKRKALNGLIHNLLNSIIDNFVDHHLLEKDNYYNLWFENKRRNLKNGIYLGRWRVDLLIGDFLCEYLNCNYILKEENKNQLHVEITKRLTQIEKYILKKNNFSETNLDLLKKKLNQFENLRYIRDSKKILKFLYGIITEIGKNFGQSFWERDAIDRQFDIIFNFSYNENYN